MKAKEQHQRDTQRENMVLVNPYTVIDKEMVNKCANKAQKHAACTKQNNKHGSNILSQTAPLHSGPR